MKVFYRFTFAVILFGTLPAHAWHNNGHYKSTLSAVTLAQTKLPDFFMREAKSIAQISQDPDLFKDPALPQLKSSETPEHFINMEQLKGEKLPELRSMYSELCFKNKLNPFIVGFLPYAIIEWEQKLTIALAEFRRWPSDEAIQTKCQVYAGIMVHYAADCTQPLHVTINFDGKARPDGSSPRTGIHNKVDALLGKADERQIGPDLIRRLHSFPSVWDAINSQMASALALMPHVYEMEKSLFDTTITGKTDPAIIAFTDERFKATVLFLADLFISAWEKSAEIQLPVWDKR
ncbi:MAG: hypothetical protein PHC61_08060 [Chitinivibrionales bacterium]|nr:hypothetical protein [Chitinivibrionales bacterium]